MSALVGARLRASICSGRAPLFSFYLSLSLCATHSRSPARTKSRKCQRNHTLVRGPLRGARGDPEFDTGVEHDAGEDISGHPEDYQPGGKNEGAHDP